MNRFFFVALLLCLSGNLQFSATAADNPSTTETKAHLAVGKGWAITASRLDELYGLLKLRRGGKPLPPKENLTSDLLKRAIDTQVLLSHAALSEQQIASNRATAFVRQASEQHQDPAEFKAVLRNCGLTETQFFRLSWENEVCQQVIERAVVPRVKITQKEVEEYYSAHSNLFTIPARVRAQVLFLSMVNGEGRQVQPGELQGTQRRAEQLANMARAGTNFLELINRHSQDPTTKNLESGSLYAQGQMAGEVDAFMFSSTVGEVSGPHQTSGGFYVVKVLEKLPAGAQPLSEVADGLKNFLREARMNEALDSFLEELRQKSEVKMVGVSGAQTASLAKD
jgi:hypothetical protein